MTDALTDKRGQDWEDVRIPPTTLNSITSVSHPPHYGGKENPYEVIKVIEAWGLSFHQGNVLKYLERAGKKANADELEDLEKARWYLSRWIALRRDQIHNKKEK